MPFSESVKLEVKRKAAFRCCRCQSIGIDVHHILPVKDGGKDEFENAAPLCQNCHDQFGDNPVKRKEIGQMRDWWYERCEELFSGRAAGDLDVLNRINARLDDIQRGQTDLSDLKVTLREIVDKMIDGISPATASTAATGIVNTSSAVSYASAVQLGPKTYANFYCTKCGTRIGLLVGAEVCPNCGEPIR